MAVMFGLIPLNIPTIIADMGNQMGGNFRRDTQGFRGQFAFHVDLTSVKGVGRDKPYLQSRFSHVTHEAANLFAVIFFGRFVKFFERHGFKTLTFLNTFEGELGILLSIFDG